MRVKLSRPLHTCRDAETAKRSSCGRSVRGREGHVECRDLDSLAMQGVEGPLDLVDRVDRRDEVAVRRCVIRVEHGLVASGVGRALMAPRLAPLCSDGVRELREADDLYRTFVADDVVARHI